MQLVIFVFLCVFFASHFWRVHFASPPPPLAADMPPCVTPLHFFISVQLAGSRTDLVRMDWEEVKYDYLERCIVCMLFFEWTSPPFYLSHGLTPCTKIYGSLQKSYKFLAGFCKAFWYARPNIICMWVCNFNECEASKIKM